MTDIKVIAHQQHRPGRELEDVLTRAVAQDRLQPAQAPRAHHDQISVQFIGHLQHRLLGVALANDRVDLRRVQSQSLNGLSDDACSLLGMLGVVLTGLLGDHMQEVDAGLLHGRDVAQHAHHFLDVAFA